MMKRFILSITPNPALDLSGSAHEIVPNEKTYVFDERRDPGGNALNAARIIKRLGFPVIASGFLGGSTGDEVENLILEEGLQTHFIKIKKSTRVNVTVSNQKDHRQTRLSFPGPPVSSQEKQQLFKLLQNERKVSLLIVGGSLPQGFLSKDLFHLMKIAAQKDIPVIVDCPGEILGKVITANPLLVKPNLEEFHLLTGKRVKSIRMVSRVASTYLSRVPYVCVSSVEGGTLLVTRKGCFFGRIPSVRIQSSVGAGDSMVGAMASEIFKGSDSPEEILRWGLAGAAATLSNKGTHLGSAALIKALFKKTQVYSV